MHQTCAIPPRSDENLYFRGGMSCWKRLRRKYLSLVMVSPKNPLTSSFFKSATSIKEEQTRQLQSKHPYIIHPFSMVRLFYDVWITIMYVVMLITKPIDGAVSYRESVSLPFYPYVSLTVDLVSWLDIGTNFFMGYVAGDSRTIEMHPKTIARNYVVSVFFLVDTLSSLPRFGLRLIFGNLTGYGFLNKLLGVWIILFHLKLVRVITLLQLVHKISTYFNIKSRGHIFWFETLLVTMTVIHWTSCLQLTTPKLVRDYFSNDIKHYDSWLDQFKLTKIGFGQKYLHAFFKSSACLLGIRINLYQMLSTEDYVLVIFTYIVGKIIICAVWIIVVISILNRKSMTVKYFAMINQLIEYMRQKQLPLSLRLKILTYYEFKFPKKYFKDTMIHSLLSARLRKDINLHVCQKLINSVVLFSQLTPTEVGNVVDLLVPEIFLPKDTIIQSGTVGNAMYFLFSGTVAVYTHSGKEVCHLQDGAYFGEIALVFKDSLTSATIIAIEITEVYRLNKKDFEKTLCKNGKVLDKIYHNAHKRLAQTKEAEEAYKVKLFEEMHGASSPFQ